MRMKRSTLCDGTFVTFLTEMEFVSFAKFFAQFALVAKSTVGEGIAPPEATATIP
jgi:hypothetical protein